VRHQAGLKYWARSDIEVPSDRHPLIATTMVGALSTGVLRCAAVSAVDTSEV
jgi:hypothetical protein